MKLTKKKVFLTAIAVSLIAILSLGTLAWFTAEDDVTNKFMVAGSDNNNPDEVFSVEVWETENDGDDNADADGDGDNKVTHEGNTYDKIAPGDELTKDPTVENTGEYDQWIRVTVTLSDAQAWTEVLRAHGITDLSKIFIGHDESVWTRGNTSTDATADTLTYEYYLNDRLAPDATATLFTSVKILDELTQDDLAKTGSFEMDILAEAIQADNTGDSAQDAFANYWE